MISMNALLRPLRTGFIATFILAAVLDFSTLAQTAPATQVPAGSTATIRRDLKKTAPDPDAPKSQALLKGALDSQTRKTLQEAMDSAPAPK
jgi:hypothetical protein